MKFFKLIVLAFLLVTVSCKKKDVSKADAHFVGEWESTGQNTYYFMDIGLGDHIRYESDNEFYSGRGKVNKKKNILYIDKVEFSIDKYPYQTTDTTGANVWRMTLKGIEYERVN